MGQDRVCDSELWLQFVGCATGVQSGTGVIKHACAGTAQSQSAPQSSGEGVSVGLGSDHKPESQLFVIAVP